MADVPPLVHVALVLLALREMTVDYTSTGVLCLGHSPMFGAICSYGGPGAFPRSLSDQLDPCVLFSPQALPLG